MAETYDVIVMGAGPGGYVAAIRAAQLGLKTACIDAWQNEAGKPSPGGTCLNVGCIPSKAMIESSEQYEHVLQGLADHGIKASGVSLDLKTMLARKDKVVQELTGGVSALLAANKIDFIHGAARLLADKVVEVQSGNKLQQLQGKNVIIATGSSPAELPSLPFDGKTIVDSTGALAFDKVPKRIVMVGIGVIGLELGSVWRRLGAEVMMLEYSDTFLHIADRQVATEALKQFKAQGLDIRLCARIKGAKLSRGKAEIEFDDTEGSHKEKVDKIIVAVGRRPNTADVLAEDAGVQLDERGFVMVDEQCRTGAEGVYAIGDVVRGPMLAHKASEEGVAVAETIHGQYARVDLETIPSVIYTQPEIAWVGPSEEQLKAAGVDYKTGNFPFAANGRAKALGETAGFIKVMADAKTDRILGVHIIGPQASEIVAQAKIAMELGASSEDLALTMFAHPTLSETLHEAALSVDGRSLHSVQKSRRKRPS